MTVRHVCGDCEQDIDENNRCGCDPIPRVWLRRRPWPGLNVEGLLDDIKIDLDRRYILEHKSGSVKRRLHLELNTTRPSQDGKHAFELGAKVGYWPCLRGPFISIQLGFRRLDFWCGLPSYWKEGAPPS